MSKPRVLRVRNIGLKAEEERFVADCFKGIVDYRVNEIVKQAKPGLFRRLKRKLF